MAGLLVCGSVGSWICAALVLSLTVPAAWRAGPSLAWVAMFVGCVLTALCARAFSEASGLARGYSLGRLAMAACLGMAVGVPVAPLVMYGTCSHDLIASEGLVFHPCCWLGMASFLGVSVGATRFLLKWPEGRGRSAVEQQDATAGRG